jgi:SAM-dependent methyltransferase
MNATCRSCGQVGLQPILNLGYTPLANALLSAEQLAAPEPVYPLELAFCPRCTLVQIRETVPPEVLFRAYPYFSSFAETMLCHARTLATRMIAERKLDRDSLIVEAASNDGYLLQHYRDAGIPVLGIEPACNVAHVARTQFGIDTRCDFFSADLATTLVAAGCRADVFHAHNVLAHVADLNGFVRGIHTILKDNGIAIIEVPYVRDLVENVEFDTIYHEHLCYFSATALAHLFHRHDLCLQDTERLPIHGGSLRLIAARRGAARPGSRRVLPSALAPRTGFEGSAARVPRRPQTPGPTRCSLRRLGQRHDVTQLLRNRAGDA